jgi:hypothetical protein
MGKSRKHERGKPDTSSTSYETMQGVSIILILEKVELVLDYLRVHVKSQLMYSYPTDRERKLLPLW